MVGALVLLVTIIIVGVWYVGFGSSIPLQTPTFVAPTTKSVGSVEPLVALEVVAERLTIPWEVLFCPMGNCW